MTDVTPQPGWYPEPANQAEQRYWDGTSWTEHVVTARVQSAAPLARTRSEARAQTSEGTTVEPATAASPNALASEKVPVFGARKHAEKLRNEVERLQSLIDQHGLQDIAELDAVKQSIIAESKAVERRVADANEELGARQAEVHATRATLLDLRGAVEVQEFGLYDYEHPAEDSVALATQLEVLRADIKSAVREGRATQATSNFTFNNSSAKGAKFVRDMSKLMLRS